MKTNISKKELKRRLEDLHEHVQEVGFTVGNDELNYMTDQFRNEYAEFETKLEQLIEELDQLK